RDKDRATKEQNTSRQAGDGSRRDAQPPTAIERTDRHGSTPGRGEGVCAWESAQPKVSETLRLSFSQGIDRARRRFASEFRYTLPRPGTDEPRRRPNE